MSFYIVGNRKIPTIDTPVSTNPSINTATSNASLHSASISSIQSCSTNTTTTQKPLQPAPASCKQTQEEIEKKLLMQRMLD